MMRKLVALLSVMFILGCVQQSSFGANENPKACGTKAELIFFHSEWCPHCRSQVPIIAEIAEEYGDCVNVIDIDLTDVGSLTDDELELVERYDISGIPHTIVNGESFVGTTSKEELTGAMAA